MKTLFTLVKREYWEQSNLFFKVPLALAVVICMAGFSALVIAVFGPNAHIHSSDWNYTSLSWILQITAVPFAVVMGLMLFYYFVSTLYEDRKDRSVLFWQSMPITQWQMLLAKCIAGMVVAPFMTWVALIITQCILLIFTSVFLAMYPAISWLDLWHVGFLFSSWLKLLAIFVVQALWLLPLFSWCLFWSAYAKRMPSLSALVSLSVLMLLEMILLSVHCLSHFVFSRFSYAVSSWQLFGFHGHAAALPNLGFQFLIGLVVSLCLFSLAGLLRARCYDFDH